MGHVLDVLLPGVPATLAITALAFALGAVAALPLAALRRSSLAVLRWPAAAAIDLLRAVPPVAWLFLLFFGLPELGVELAVWPAAVAGLGLIASAYVAEIYRAALDGVPHGQTEAASAVGLGPLQRLRHVTGPQALIVAIPPLGSYVVGLLKDSAIASTIGLGEITLKAFTETQQSLDGLRVFGIAALLYLALSLPFGLLARWVTAVLERRMATA